MQVINRLTSRASTTATSSSKSIRQFSVLSSFPYDSTQYDQIVYPRKARGLDYDLNWSLAADSLTNRGEAYRNANIRDLLEFIPRKDIKITKEKAVEIINGPFSKNTTVDSYATDVLPNTKVMDVEEYEGRLSSLRDETLSFAPRLFVEDAAVGSSRLTELRVRLITDSPIVALYFRNLLHRIPLYSPEIFPRTLTVYAATLATNDSTAARGTTNPFTVVDVDPQSSRGVVLSVGKVNLSSIADAINTAASQLVTIGGYRSVPGGNNNVNIAKARAENVLHWYYRDGHYYAPVGEPHPDILPIKGDVVLNNSNQPTLVIGGSVASNAIVKNKLYTSNGTLWSATLGLTSTWSGVTVPNKTVPLVRGALVTQGSTVVPLANQAKAVGQPASIVVINNSKTGNISTTDAPALIKSVAGLTDKQVEKLTSRLSSGKITVTGVPNAAEAAKSLGL